MCVAYPLPTACCLLPVACCWLLAACSSGCPAVGCRLSVSAHQGFMVVKSSNRQMPAKCQINRSADRQISQPRHVQSSVYSRFQRSRRITCLLSLCSRSTR
ncbi:hypothetical protein GGR50DRAFT_110966 [Xylaria sp. CBS 124048]|nr:hypothetical protein GGR50DRAFT_110966 [Xylaria sp. CBS 124048]